MNMFLELGFDTELCHRICLTLAHSLWQVSLLTALAALIVSRLRKDRPERGYSVYVTALVLTLAVLPLTYWQLGTESTVIIPHDIHKHEIRWPEQSQNSLPSMDRYAVLPADSESVSPLPTIVSNQVTPSIGFISIAPWLLGIYSLGVVIMLLRMGQGIWKTQRLAGLAEPITSGPLATSLERVARSWSLRVLPRLAQAQKILVPQVVGLLRPTILIPTSALTGLTTAELEMILAHELAHVRRYDMWVNLLQRLAEAVLFFNPALWYLSRQISLYREYCCDEQTCRGADQSPASRVQYAQALLRIVELSGKQALQPELVALAASGGRPSELRRRVARLFGEPLREPIRVSRSGLLALVVGLVLIAVAPLGWQNAAEPAKEKNEQAAVVEKSEEPTVEVIAIGTHDEEPQRWWNAEGQLLDSMPFKWKDANNVSSSEKVWRRIVFSIFDLPEDAEVVWNVLGGGSWGDATATPIDPVQNQAYFARYLGLREKSETLGLRVGIASGPWVTSVKGTGLQANGIMGTGIIFSGAFAKDEGCVVVVSHNLSDVNVRVIAIDKTGKQHISKGLQQVSAVGGLNQMHWSFQELKSEDVDHFEFQTRMYEWTEIDNLPVESGKKLIAKQSHASESVKLDLLPPNQAVWIKKLHALTDHKSTAFSVGPQMIAELSPQEAWEIVGMVWPNIQVDEVKTGLLKTFEFARHPKVLEVLDLGAKDESEFVRDYAYAYLQNYALRDFRKPEHKYESWRDEFANKKMNEVLAANCQWFVDQLRSQPTITDLMAWQETEMMLELSGSKSLYPVKAEYLIKAGLPELIKNWLADPYINDQMQQRFQQFLKQLDSTLDENQPYRRANLSGRNLEGLSLLGNVDSLFMNADLSKTDLSNATLVGGAKAFYGTNFSEANFKDAVLIGQASMQKAKFSGANLDNTLLKSGVSGLAEANFDDAVIQGSRLCGSLQLASFRRARIADTRFEGIGPAMQMSNFNDAQLTNTTLIGTSFQVVSLNNTQFKECDLSTVEANDLASSKFEPATPPRYDAATKFPEDFDPADHGWKLIE